MIMHISFDLIGNDLQSQVMTHLWFGIRMKHLSVWDLYTLSSFPLFSIVPSVFSECLFRNEMLMSKISFVAMGNSINLFSFPTNHIVFLQKCILLWLVRRFISLPKRVGILVKGMQRKIMVIHHPCYPETSESDSMRRQIMVIRHPCYPETSESDSTRRQIMVIRHPCYLETSESDSTRR